MKTQKPFTPDASKKVEKMTEAAAHVYAAIQALKEAQNSAAHWAEHETLASYAHELTEFMSCDHGEAGLEPYLKKKVEDVFPLRKKNPIRAARNMAHAYNRQGKLVKMVVPED